MNKDKEFMIKWIKRVKMIRINASSEVKDDGPESDIFSDHSGPVFSELFDLNDNV